jgi:hypothetical protein
MTDSELLSGIRDVLATSPFVGEGHRKVVGPAAPPRRVHRAQAGAAVDP